MPHVLILVTGSAGAGKSSAIDFFKKRYNQENPDSYATSYDRDKAREELKKEKEAEELGSASLASSSATPRQPKELSEEEKEAIYNRLVNYAKRTFKEYAATNCVVCLEGNWGKRFAWFAEKHLDAFKAMNINIKILQFRIKEPRVQHNRVLYRNHPRDHLIMDFLAFCAYRSNRFKEEEQGVALMRAQGIGAKRSIIDNSIDIPKLPIADQNQAYTNLYTLMFNIAFRDLVCISPRLLGPTSLRRSASLESFPLDRAVSASPNLLILMEGIDAARRKRVAAPLPLLPDGLSLHEASGSELKRRRSSNQSIKVIS